MNVPENLKYAESHEWLLIDGGNGTVGISDHAQAELTDIVFVELPEPGRKVAAGESVAVVESVKAASDIYAPASGTITEVNEALQANPALVNTDAFGEGWLFRMELSAPEEADSLKDAAAYRDQIA